MAQNIQGYYKGKPVYAGTDAEVMTQMQTIDRGAPALPPAVSSAPPTAPQAPGAPPPQAPAPGQTKASSLLNFSNALTQATNLAKQKRNGSMVGFMAPMQGTMMASDFNSILSGMNTASSNYTGELTKNALEAAQPNLMEVSAGATLYDPYTGKSVYTAPVSAQPGNDNMMTDNERALFAQFRGEPIVKDYNTILQKKLSVEGILQSGVGGPQDLAIVFEFMKALDPTSVVREQEYENAAKSGNIFMGALAKYNGYLKESGGFLPESVRKEFLNIVNSKFQVQTKLYENTAKEYRRIAEAQGLDPNNVILNYQNAAPGGTSGGTLQDLDFTF